MNTLILAACLVASTITLPDSGGSAPAPREEPMTLQTPTGAIEGTLTLPAEGAGPYPVALIIAGSGPTDRDGNSPAGVRTDAYKLIANDLAARGIATLRYDKRGIAASRAAGRSESDLRFDDYVRDAEGWLTELRADRRFTTVTVIGHSEGSLIGMVAAPAAHADGYISLEGAGLPAAVVLRTQLAGKLPPDLAAESERILSGLEKGQTTDSVPAPLQPLYRASVQPYLISWFKYDPATEIAKLQIPALIVQGTHDAQIGLDEAQRLAKADPQATLLVLDGMTHVLKDAPAGLAAQTAAYTDPSLPLDPKLVPAIAEFVERLRR
ncbi:MAG: alpha/beta fold hydrolase [Gemmatimonadaceae bacterium]|nr:alpha/beta fold hydrolase [Gemmatimonadaceae bacterium]